MPSTSAKQHRFMAAIAHSPSFAKKAGVSQSVGKDFNAADKGKTFNKGGMMKMRKFNGEEDSFVGDRDNDPEAQKVYSNVGRGSALVSDDNENSYYEVTPEQRATSRAATRAASNVTAAAPRAAAAPAKPSSSAGSSTVSPAQETALKKRENDAFETTLAKGAKKRADVKAEETSAVTSMPMRGGRVKDDEGVSRYASESLTPEQRKDNAKNLAIEAVLAAPMAKGVQFAYRSLQAAKAAKAAKAAERARDLSTPMRELLSERRAAGFRGHKSGGKIMESKKMRKFNGEEGSMGGGMAKYAKGGGIESRGKTKGTIIRMASGGSVSSASRRADGIAQRGKTRC